MVNTICRIPFDWLKSLSLSLFLLGVGAPNVAAQNAFWANDSGGFYTDISNWIPMAIPTVTNDLVFQRPGDYRVDTLDNRAVNQIYVLDNAGVTLDLHDAAAGVGVVLAVASDVTVAESELAIGDGNGTKRLLIDVDGLIDVTGFASDPTRGRLTVNNDGILRSGNVILGHGSGRFGWARVTGEDAEWSMANSSLSIGSAVGDGGGGQLLVENGGEFSAAFITMGIDELSAGQLDRGELMVSGIGNDGMPSIVNLTGGMNIGVEGRGVVTVDGGGQVIIGGRADIGDVFGGMGIVDIVGTDAAGNPSTWEMGDLYITRTNQTNGIRFRDGARVVTDGEMGFAFGEISLVGVAPVGGAPTTWTVTGNMGIGIESSDIDIEAGARLVAGSVTLAVGSSTAGSLLLRDSTPDRVSSLEVAGDALIGGTESTRGGAANFQVGANTKASIGGTFKLWSNAFFGLEGDFFAGEIDITDAVEASFAMISGSLSFDAFRGDLVAENIVVSPGATTSSATLFGEYEQAPSATLRFDVNGPLAGAGYDQLTVTGNAQLDGTLALTLGPGFAPDPEETLVVLGSTFLSGTFDNIASGGRLTTLDGRGSFIVHYGLGSPHGAHQIVLSGFMAELLADLNHDGAVDAADAALLFAEWGESPSGSPADFNDDGLVDAADAGLMFGEWTGDSAQIVPEPASLAFHMAIGAWVLGIRRRAMGRRSA